MMYDPRLVENRNPEKYSNLSTYDMSRLFSLIMDRAMTQMPWGIVNTFMLEKLSQTTSDMEIGQRSAVQFYLFTSKASLLKAATHELIYQIATSSQAYKEWTDDFKSKLQLEFEMNAPRAFEPVRGREFK